MDKGLYASVMSKDQFLHLKELIQSTCGIKLPLAKKSMLEGRLRKRMRVLGIDSFDGYFEYLLSTHGSESEITPMIDVVTTNKTDFFREPDHFDYLTATVLPELVKHHGWGVRRPLNVWSAGCSTGEEPYTLAMVLSEFAQGWGGEFHFSVLGTDISTAVLDKAKTGIYGQDRVDPVPLMLRRKYLLRSKDKDRGLVRVAPEVRALVRFQRLNFMAEKYAVSEAMGVIFCRNVIIYFDRPTQCSMLNRLVQCLLPGGYLFLGHSETLHGMDLPLCQTATTVYRKL